MPESSLGLCRQRAFGPEALFGWASAWPHPENHPRGGGQKTRGGRGVTQEIWTFDGEVSGPTIEGHLCEFFYVTLVDHTSRYHSIDFHAAEDPTNNMAQVAQGIRPHKAFEPSTRGSR